MVVCTFRQRYAGSDFGVLPWFSVTRGFLWSGCDPGGRGRSARHSPAALPEKALTATSPPGWSNASSFWLTARLPSWFFIQPVLQGFVNRLRKPLPLALDLFVMVAQETSRVLKLCPACRHPARRGRKVCHRRARQRALRRRSGRNGEEEATQAVRGPHSLEAPDRDLVFARREGQCPLVRQETRVRGALDEGALGLRSEDQPALLHPEEGPPWGANTSTSS